MKRLCRNPQIVWRVEKGREQKVLEAMERGEDVSDEGTVLLIDAGMMHQLNFVGASVWLQCDGTRTLSEIVDLLAADFDVDREVLAADVEEFVASLVERGWLHHG